MSEMTPEQLQARIAELEAALSYDPRREIAIEEKDSVSAMDMIYHTIYTLCEDADNGNVTAIQSKRYYLRVMFEDMAKRMAELENRNAALQLQVDTWRETEATTAAIGEEQCAKLAAEVARLKELNTALRRVAVAAGVAYRQRNKGGGLTAAAWEGYEEADTALNEVLRALGHDGEPG